MSWGHHGKKSSAKTGLDFPGGPMQFHHWWKLARANALHILGIEHPARQIRSVMRVIPLAARPKCDIADGQRRSILAELECATRGRGVRERV